MCPSVVGRSGWLSLALMVCSPCLKAEAVVTLLVAFSVRSLPLWLVRLVVALGWVVIAAVARCLALGWLSVLVTLIARSMPAESVLWLALLKYLCKVL